MAGVVEPDPEAGLVLLREAVAVLDGSPARPARAKALIELGAALPKTGDEGGAKEALLAGLELAHRIRASLLVSRAGAELVALGAEVPERPTTGYDALSASERRVATRIAEGLGVDEIAQSLFLTPATVEDYLARARRTLGVETNEQLADADGARRLAADGAQRRLKKNAIRRQMLIDCSCFAIGAATFASTSRASARSVSPTPPLPSGSMTALVAGSRYSPSAAT